MPNLPPHLYDETDRYYEQPKGHASDGCVFVLGFVLVLYAMSPTAFWICALVAAWVAFIVMVSRAR